MKERPTLFGAPMVREILADTKTQTRRIAKFTANGHLKEPGGHRRWHPDDPEASLACPYGQPGDRLWVRENHYLHGIWSVRKDDEGKRRWRFHPNRDMGVHFTEPNGFIKGRSTTVAGWYRRPSIHMPRWASRITLEITGVRLERLQDISEADAQAEGVKHSLHLPGGRFASENFAHLWWTIHGDDAWEANPVVWVIGFKRLQP